MEDNTPLKGSGELEAENDFMKMKLMLEHGARFGGNEKNDLPPELENEFLKNVMAFEEQWAARKTISVFDKIGRPGQFKAVADIKDKDLDEAWNELKNHLNENGIDLDACSPKVSTRELYRFTTEELFSHEVDDIDLPGWTTNFIYDEFHPDKEYDNSIAVSEILFRELFSKEFPLRSYSFDSTGIIFNGKYYDDFESLNKQHELFKSCFDEISLEECEVTAYESGEIYDTCRGNYMAKASSQSMQMNFSGQFSVRMILKEDYWVFKEIMIQGLNFAAGSSGSQGNQIKNKET